MEENVEIKVNKDFRSHKEAIFFGLSLRQLVCCALALGAALGVYFGLHDILGDETTSWLCILAAAPIGVAGFFQYNGMTFEKYVWQVVKTCFLCAGPRKWKSENYLYEALAGKEAKHD